MKNRIAVALCGLALLCTSLSAPARAEFINPREAVVKAIAPTPAQVKKLDTLKAAMEKKTSAVLGGLEQRYVKRVLALAGTEPHKTKIAEVEKLPEGERDAALEKVWSELNAAARPGLEKDMFNLMRGLVVDYFDSVGKFVTAAQKPKLAKARTAVLANVDKGLPEMIHNMTADLKVDKPQ